MRYILQKYGSAAILPVVLSALVLSTAFGLRYGMLESGFLPAACGGSVAEGMQGWCGFKWLLVQSFLHQRLGWLAFACGVLAFVRGSQRLALAGWCFGLAGLVLYNYELAAVGALLSLLVFGRRPTQGRRSQRQPSQ